jgi:Carboxypeptidase regulatory-like domain/TonB-dependent Receptor Plug Domain
MKLLRAVALLFLVTTAGELLAQTGSIGGVVTDPSGAVVGEVKVTATNKATNLSRTTTTSASGIYSIPNLDPGPYSVAVEKQGFKSTKVDNVQLSVAQVLVVNPQLALGSLQETVEVNGENVAPIETESSQLSNLIDSHTMTNLPLLTRNPYELVLLSPGVNQPNNGSNGFSVNGSRDRNNNFLLDGVDNNDTSVPGGGTGISPINPDSAQEFRVITNNFDPEYGRNTGAIIDVVTRGGTNSFHGDAYWFGRYNALGARDFFNTRPDPQNPYVRNDFGFSIGGPIKKSRTFFFINNEYQRFRTTLTSTTLLPTQNYRNGTFTGFSIDPVTGDQHPVSVDLTSASSPTNLTGLTVDPTVQQVFNLLPLPNGQNSTSDISAIDHFGSPDNLNSYTWTGKLDHNLTSKHQIHLRYAFSRNVDSNPFHTEFAPGIDEIASPSYSHGVLAGLTSTFSNTVINDFRFGWNKVYAAFNSNCGGFFDPITGVDALGNGRDLFVPNGVLGIGPQSDFGCNALFSATGQARNTGTTSYSDTLTWVKGNHTFKFGGDFRNVRSSGYDDFVSRDVLLFNNIEFGGPLAFPVNPGDIPDPVTEDMAWFLVGGIAAQEQFQFFNKAGTRVATDNKSFRQREADGFVGDSWKIRSNLTLNLGIRYQYNGVPFETGGNFSNLFQNPDTFNSTYTFTVVGPGTRGMYNPDYKDIEPRIGFAWDPFKTSKTSIRGGYGIFHDRIFDNLFGNARSNPPFQSVPTAFFLGSATPENAPFLTSTPPGLTYNNGDFVQATLLDPNIVMPASQNWNFGMQQQVAPGLVVEADYVGSHGTHVIRLVDAVPPDPALVQQAITDCVTATVCAPGDPQGIISGPVLYTGIPGVAGPSIRETAVQSAGFFPPTNFTKTNADSRYNALQVKVTKRLSHGLQLGGAYTWAHAIDNSNDPLTPEAGQGSFPLDSRNPNQTARGNSDNDIRHRGVVNFSYEFPFGPGQSFLTHGVLAQVVGGISLSGIISAQTGHPYTVFSPFDNGRNGIAAGGGSWPDVVGQLHSLAGPRIQVGGVATGLDPNDFSSTFLGHLGNAGRNQFYGPHYTSADMVLAKNVHINERFGIQIRSEFYNIFNHPQFLQPGNSLSNPGTFGLSTGTITRPDGTTSARQIQLAVKLLF